MTYDEIKDVERYADNRSPDMLLMKSEEKNEARESLHDRLFDLIDFAVTRPEAWKVLKLKLRNPNMGLRELAKELKISHETVRRCFYETSETLGITLLKKQKGGTRNK